MGADKDKKVQGDDYEEIMRIRVALKGRETKPLEWACNEMITRAKNKGYETRGPVRIPTKILRVTTRKSPSVREPTPGIDMNSESTRESLISCAHPPLLRTSPLSRLMHPSMSTLLCPEDECCDSFLERVYSTLIEHQCGIRLPRFANE